MPNTFTNGKRAIAECDRCGFRFKLNQLRTLVIKTKNVNLKVCDSCWEPDHPQLQLGMYPVADPQALLDPRPDRVEYAQMRAAIQPVYSYLSGSARTFATGSVGTVGIDTPVDVAVSGVPSTFYLGSPVVVTPTNVAVSGVPSTFYLGSPVVVTSEPEWVLRTSSALPISSNYWQQTAFGNGVFVALASYDGYAARSTDGISWTYVSGLPNLNFTGLAYGAGLFVATAASTSTYLTSPDGVTWTSRTLPFVTNGPKIIFANGVFIAVYPGNTVLRSTDGINWTAISSGISTTFTGYSDVAYGNNVWIVMPTGVSRPRYLTSTDNGVSWTTRATPSIFTGMSSPISGSLTFGAGRFCFPFNVPGTDNIATTTDGISWTGIAVPISTINTIMTTMAFGGGRFFWRSAQVNTTDQQKCFYSFDGLSWIPVLADASTGNLSAYGTTAFGNNKFLWTGNNVSPYLNVNTYAPA